MIITAITPQKYRANRSSVFVDGRFVFGMSDADIALHHLVEGMSLSQTQLDDLLNRVVYTRAQETALRYLAYQARTRQETIQRLQAEDYDEALIARVMAFLDRYRYVDDAAYADAYARSRLQHGLYGVSRVKTALRQKGIDRETVDAACANAVAEYDETAGALAWLRKKRGNLRDPVQKKRCIDALLRRGFSYDTVKAAYAAWLAETAP